MPDDSITSENARPAAGLERWIKDPFCGLSHAVGAVASVVGLIVLLSLIEGDAVRYVGIGIYGASLILLFTASAVAHSLHANDRWSDRLDRFDYCAIFCLIAGTYTPICLTALRGPWGYTMLAIEWGIALVGISCVLFTRIRTKYISPLFVPMGWLVTIAIVPMARGMPTSALLWLIAGGVIYSLGAVVFITERPRLWPRKFGWHDLWHTMVLAGAVCHYIAVTIII